MQPSSRPHRRSLPVRIRESKIERYFMQQVTLHGGDTRKLRYFAAPDRMVIWPPDEFDKKYSANPRPTIEFVELKAPDGEVRVRQKREHGRLRALGCEVFVLYTKSQVNDYVARR